MYKKIWIKQKKGEWQGFIFIRKIKILNEIMINRTITILVIIYAYKSFSNALLANKVEVKFRHPI